MRLAVFQFRGISYIKDNHKAIKRAIESASRSNVRLLVFQECAACGYPPVETPSARDIDFGELAGNLAEIKTLAQRYGMYIALGTIRKEESSYYDSIQLINPEGKLQDFYDKRALWGWDLENFEPGSETGIFEIDDIKIGFRICFELRFPEYFRELFKAKTDICFVSLCDVQEQESAERYEAIKSYLSARAMENVMTLISVNSISKYQTGPTAVFDINGSIIHEAPRNQEYLLIYDYSTPEISFGARGRLEHSSMLVK